MNITVNFNDPIYKSKNDIIMIVLEQIDWLQKQITPLEVFWLYDDEQMPYNNKNELDWALLGGAIGLVINISPTLKNPFI